MRPQAKAACGRLLFAARIDALLLRGTGVIVAFHRVQDAEDVCQATFLVLARKAPTIRKQTSVGSWLYGVAYRLALKAKAEAAKRHTRSSIHRFALAERTSNDSSPGILSRARSDKSTEQPDLLSEITWREVCTALDEELARLPDRFTRPEDE